MTSDRSGLLLALGIFSVGSLSIGPNFLAIIGTSMERGRGDGTALVARHPTSVILTQVRIHGGNALTPRQFAFGHGGS